MNPTRIGGYEILGELGRGAMGVVYHARDAAIGRPVAIKVIRIDAGTSAEESANLRQRLIREASVAGKIYHPGIVTVHQLGEEGSNVFIVMEFVEGSSLERLLTHNPQLDRAWALDILAQIAVALDYAHKAGVVHRDIKPANILVRADGRVKIADFGIAKMTASATSGMTAAGVSIGSPAYMSPEQIQASEIDGRSDQFALATIAFQMLAGRMPFRGTTAHTLMFQIVTADPFDQQPGDAPLAPAVRAVLARALAKKAPDRFPDCASFIQTLTDAAGGRRSPAKKFHRKYRAARRNDDAKTKGKQKLDVRPYRRRTPDGWPARRGVLLLHPPARADRCVSRIANADATDANNHANPCPHTRAHSDSDPRADSHAACRNASTCEGSQRSKGPQKAHSNSGPSRADSRAPPGPPRRRRQWKNRRSEVPARQRRERQRNGSHGQHASDAGSRRQRPPAQ